MRSLDLVRTMLITGALAVSAAALSPAQAHAAGFVPIGITVGFATPALPVYTQPPIPAPGYIWTPGYWAYGPAGYFWVPGTWVMAPELQLRSVPIG